MPKLGPTRFVRRSLFHHRRINVAIALGVAAATAVLTGALLVGDSMRSSLRRLTLDRLGRIDEILITDRFFDAGLAESLRASPGFDQHYQSAVGAVLLPNCTLEGRVDEETTRASNVTLFGADEMFWRELAEEDERPERLPGDEQIVINEPLARELRVTTGDTVTVRLPQSRQIPADSPLGRRDDSVRSLVRFEIVDVLPAKGLGRFSLQASQMQPLNAFLSLQVVRDALRQDGKINAILVAGQDPSSPPDQEAGEALEKMLHPTLEDFGLTLPFVQRAFQDPETGREEIVFRYFNLTSDRMVISPEVEVAAEHAFAADHAQPALTYLATSIEPDGNPELAVPYSTITAIDSTPQLGPLLDENGKVINWRKEDDIVLTDWFQREYGWNVNVGDRIRVRYFLPETLHGEVVEDSHVFTVRAIVSLPEPKDPYGDDGSPPVFDVRPAPTNDPDLTPTVEGITDKASIDTWEAPFPYDSTRLNEPDRTYWDNHRTTPKAYVSLSKGQELWGSRFGRITSVRIPAVEGTDRVKLADKLLDQLRRDQVSLGFDFIPVKRQGLRSAAGTTPFDALFLALSFFIIAAALLLVSLLFRLGIDQRAVEIGILRALGGTRRLTSRLMLAEGAAIATIGSAAGLVIGVAYAWLMLAGLRSSEWWLGAVTTAFLRLAVTPRSLLIGFLCGVVVSVLTILWSVRSTRRLNESQLLAGKSLESVSSLSRTGRLARWSPLVLLAVAVLLGGGATIMSAQAQAGAFVGGGAMVLAALLIWTRNRLRAGGETRLTGGGFPLTRLAVRNAARSPGRSAMTIGLMATATFLIVAMSSFRLTPTDRGSGGFDLLAESSVPIYDNLNVESVRRDLLADGAELLSGGTFLALRMQPGDDASCRNLYKPTSPRVLGVTPDFVRHFDSPDAGGGFEWAATSASTPEQQDNPWRLLRDAAKEADSDAIPVVLDKNTAMYSLGMYGGVIGKTIQFDYGDGRLVRFKVVGLLSNSIFQGSLLIDEERFQESFPLTSGYRYFLVRSPSGRSEQVATMLEDRLGDQGFDATSTREVLEGLLAVQNTYLSAFQSLGALGLLLGAFGLAAVQLRNVFERRKEMALMRAAGFSRRRLAALVFLENVCLLLGGLAIGVFAALVAVMPHVVVGGANLPPGRLAIMLSVILLAGVLAGLIGVRATLRAPLVPALRGD